MTALLWGLTLAALTLQPPASGVSTPDAEARVRELNARARTVRVVAVDEARKMVRYLPAGVVAVDDEGQLAELAIESLNDTRSLLTGYLTLRVDVAELANLERRVSANLGEGYRLVTVGAGSFECWLRDGDNNIWHRPEGDGPIGNLPVQAEFAAKTGELTLITAVSWTERIPMAGMKVRLNWDALEDALHKNFEKKSWLGEDSLVEIVAQAFEGGAVQVEVLEGIGREAVNRVNVRVLVLDQLKRRVLAPDEPRAEKTPKAEGRVLTLTYRLRKDTARLHGTETVNLSEGREIERRVLLTGKVPTTKPQPKR